MTITGDIDDISGKLDDLASQLDGLADKTIDLVVNVSEGALPDVVQDATDAATNLGTAGDAASDLASDINTIDATAINEAASAASALGDNLGSASGDISGVTGSMGATESAADGVGAAAGIAGLGIAGTVGLMITGAGTIEDQWKRIGAVTGSTAQMSEQAWSGAIKKMTDTTGRGAGDAREFIIRMGTAGITNSDLVAEGFKMISGASFITGNSIESISTAYQRVLMSGTLGSRQLMQLGINSSDVMRATGMSVEELNVKMKGMTQEQRAALLNSIMNLKDGAVANEAYKQSWQHSLDVLERTGQYLMRVLGALVLPFAKMAVDAFSGALSGLTKWIEGLNGPTGDIIKAVLAFGIVLTGIIGVIVAVIAAMRLLQIWSALVTVGTYALRIAQALAAVAGGDFGKALMILKGQKEANTVATEVNTAAENQGILSRIKSGLATVASTAYMYAHTAAMWLLNAATTAYNFLTGGSVVATVTSAASRIALGVASGLAAVGTIAMSVATGIATVAQWALNVALSANPIGIIILLIAGLIAALIWLYQNNEWVRNGVNMLWGALQGLGGFIMGGLKNAWDALSNGVRNAGKIIMELPMFIFTLPLRVMAIFAQVAISVYKALIPGVPDAIYRALMMAYGQAVTGLMNIWVQFLNFIGWLSTLPAIFLQWITDAFMGMVNYILGIPGEIWKGLQFIIDKFWEFIDFLKSLPGRFYNLIRDAFINFINGIEERLPFLRDILETIKGLFPASPVKWGPLVGMENWGRNMAESINQGLVEHMPTVAATMNLGLSGVTVPTGGSATGGLGSSTSGINVQFTGDINIPEGGDPKQIGHDLGTGAALGLAERLKRDASTNGISYTNYKR